MGACYKNIDEFEWGLYFGQNLQAVLQSRGVTQHHLARQLGTTEAMISRYVHGTSVPSVYKVCQIANIIGCDINDLIKITY